MVFFQVCEGGVALHEVVRRDLNVELIGQVCATLGFALAAAVGKEDIGDSLGLEPVKGSGGAGDGG